MGKTESERTRFKIYTATRLVRAVGVDATKPFVRTNADKNGLDIEVKLTPKILKSLKARTIFSYWDDMIALGEGEMADEIISGGHKL